MSSSAEGGDSRQRMSRVRRTIADRMQRSWKEIPHVTAHLEADATALIAARAELASRYGLPVPFEALLLRAVVPLLIEFPMFNAYVDGNDAVTYGRYDIGIAVDTAAGLLVPVVRDAERAGEQTLIQTVRTLIERAQAGRLLPDEMRGATFTLSNIGALGGGHAVSILPPQTSALLSVGRARPAVRLTGKGPVEVPVLPVSITVDHRLIDGGPAIRFATQLIEAIQGLAPEQTPAAPGSS